MVYRALQFIHLGRPLQVFVKKVRTHSLHTVRSHEKQGILARVVRLKEAVHTGQSILLNTNTKEKSILNNLTISKYGFGRKQL